jgi:ADP-ribose pyrophosphatase
MKKTVPLDAILVPDTATKVFSGKIFDVYQWPQALFDGSTATFEMLKRPDTMEVIAVKDGKIVMVYDEQPNRKRELSFPGGRADEDASWLDAAKRELLEETGLTFKTWKLLAVYQPMPKIEQFVAWFVATDFEAQQPQKLDAGERIEVVEMPFDEMRDTIFDTGNPMLSYAKSLFLDFKTLDDVLQAAPFTGQEIDR